jgi:hypothetical protein
MYKIYQMIIHSSYENNLFNVSFSHGRRGSTNIDILELKLEEIRRLNQLLNIQNIDIRNYSYDYADVFSALCKIFKGLNLSSNANSKGWSKKYPSSESFHKSQIFVCRHLEKW